ncbi:methionyl-tRNA formyltransferase [Rhodobacteraceae bacterium CCMM004]|nr:methionyl-tRNA formyltransferase [Rhodobacteraceae bacterium CCMM004]
MERTKVHDPADASYTLFRAEDGELILQIDTYGSGSRGQPGKKSQTIQFGHDGLEQLKGILKNIREE